jgi:hypothetical protein
MRGLRSLLFIVIGLLTSNEILAENPVPQPNCMALVQSLSEQVQTLQGALDQALAQIEVLQTRVNPQLGSIQVVVPPMTSCAKCINKCGFCNAMMSGFDIPAMQSFTVGDEAFYKLQLEYARERGIDTLVITGVTEPQQNWPFLVFLGKIIKSFNHPDSRFLPFRKVEFQTTGTILEERHLLRLKDEIGVTRINLSTSALDNDVNQAYNGTRDKAKVDILAMANLIRKLGLGLRMSLNWTDFYNDKTPEWILDYVANTLHADQLTVRRLFRSDGQTPQDEWIRKHAGSEDGLARFFAFIQTHGTRQEVLPFGAYRYSIRGLNVAVDRDCMNLAGDNRNHPRYLILYPPPLGLHTRWRDPTSKY